jgi:leader peptidase (prepilin peptidase)/N-methyltransferase
MSPLDALILSATFVLVIVSPMTGSFLKCWADRAGIGQSVTDGRSYCDACGKTLAARDLVPILSWLWNRGKSRCCGVPLRWTLMTAEIVSLLLAVWAVLVVAPPLLLPTLIIAWLLQATALLAVPAPRQSTITAMILAILGLGLAWFGLVDDIEERLLGFALGLLIAAVAWTGASDPKARFLKAVTLLPAMGALLGAAGMGLALALALPAAAAHAGLSRLLAIDPGDRAPVATSLSIGLASGTWLIWLYGTSVFGGTY